MNITRHYSQPLDVSAVAVEASNNNQPSPNLQKSLGSWETWGFGLSGLLLWLGVAPSMNADLGQAAIYVWLPGTIIGILLNLQVKKLGEQWLNIAGGTPNYASKLLSRYPGLARYGAIGYLMGWVSVPPMNAIILTDLIKANLEPAGIECPETLLKILFTVIPFILAFSGTRALGILRSCFVFPAVGLLLFFSFQGLGWLSFAPASPGLLPSSWSGLSFTNWAKWFFVSVYAVLGCETASSFVADSRYPRSTLRCLKVAAILIPIVYVGGSWVLLRLAVSPDLDNNAFLQLVAASQPFWGGYASVLVTFLIACGCLLSSSTAVSNSPRILYQLAVDKLISPIFAVVSPQGIFGAGLTFSLIASLVCLIWGNIDRLLLVTGTGYLCGILALHLGLWLRRGRPEVKWYHWSGAFFLLEAIVLLVGGIVWGWLDLAIGLFLPVLVLAIDSAIRHLDFAPFYPSWWRKLYSRPIHHQNQDFFLLQVGVIIFLVCAATVIGWSAKATLNNLSIVNSRNLFVILLISSGFVGVAIACWTSLPQVNAIAQLQQETEQRFITAMQTVPDGILVLDSSGRIRSFNQAAALLFGIDTTDLLGYHLSHFLPALRKQPLLWERISEHTLTTAEGERILEVTVSEVARQTAEYIVIARDITERKRIEAEIRHALETEKELSELKSSFITMMSHEFRTPLATILSSTELLEHYAHKLPASEKAELFEQVQKSVERMTGLLDNVLTIHQTTSTLSVVQSNSINLKQFCSQIVHETQDLAGQKYQISFTPVNDCITTVVDEKILHTILSNLLANAIKYSPQGGNIQLTLSCTENQVTFQIQDWGIGIPKADEAHIFEAFRRGSNISNIPGIGLGLSVVKTMLDRIGGLISCETQEGVGTKFSVILPLIPINA